MEPAHAETRFAFGANWSAFLLHLNEERIREAEASLCSLLGIESLEGQTFLDIGSGSGLFSLAAHRLGARVHSFDFDVESVACTKELRHRFGNDGADWTVEEGSALDTAYLRSLGEFDVVYSWGVLHHTGQMMQALDNAIIPVSNKGALFIALYNDQGAISKAWTWIKRAYCSNSLGRTAVIATFVPYFAARFVAVGLVSHGHPLGHWRDYAKRRGMSPYHDWIDWLGGYPFETAEPGMMIDFFSERGFTLKKLTTTNRLGCNQFVFRRD